jgi:2-(1,2-epoxy-1,2-dihydrophenyl)acetyl-CoA isomerase
MNFQTVLFSVQSGTAIITLNRPESHNAINLQLGDDLMAALEACRKDASIRSAIITGAGKAFCSGGDLKAAKEFIGTDPPEPYRQVTKRLNRIILEIRGLAVPVIASINGPVGGAGLSIAAACDLRIASAGAKFRQAYTGLGLVPDGAWTLFVPLLAGYGRASELLLLDPVLDAQQALSLGLVNSVVDPGQLEDYVLSLAGRLSRGPTRAFAIAKELMNHSLLSLLERQLELERLGIVKAAGTEDYIEGIESFFKKKQPQFKGN